MAGGKLDLTITEKGTTIPTKANKNQDGGGSCCCIGCIGTINCTNGK
jgi:hypothetical protein